MSAPSPLRPPRRTSFGILDAATLLALTLAVVGLALPRPPARQRAAAERAAVEMLDTITDALDAVPAGKDGVVRYPDLAQLLAGDGRLAALLPQEPGAAADVRTAGPYFWTVLLPDVDGVPVPSADADRAEASRGYVVVAWPRTGEASGLRCLASVPGSVLWVKAAYGAGSGRADRPPTVHTVLERSDRAAPGPPPLPKEWAVLRSRKKGREGE